MAASSAAPSNSKVLRFFNIVKTSETAKAITLHTAIFWNLHWFPTLSFIHERLLYDYPPPKKKIKRKKRDHCITAELKYHCNWFHVILNPWMSPLSRTQYTNTKGGTARQKGSPRVTSSYMWLGILIHKNNLVTIISIACLCDSQSFILSTAKGRATAYTSKKETNKIA